MTKRSAAVVPPRVRLPRKTRIAEILVAARAVFTEYGYEGASMSVIASRVGVVEGAIYRFFSSKRDLLIAVMCHWYEEIVAFYTEGIVAQTNLRERLRFLIWHHLTCIKNSPRLLNLFYNQIRMDPNYPGSQLFKYNKWYVNQLTEILKQGQASGELRRDIPLRLVRDMVFGLAEQRTITYRAEISDFDLDRTADELTDFVLYTCSPQQTQASAARDSARLLAIAKDLEHIAQGLASRKAKS